MEKWEKIVNRNLRQTKQSYLSGMRAEHPDPYSVVFILEGKEDSRLGLMLERGQDVFDIKEGMARSSKRKGKKDGGWFIHIPFRLASAEALAESSVFSGILPRPVYEVAKGLQKGESLTVTQLPEEFRQKGVRQELTSKAGKSFPKYEHKSSIYVGLQRSTKQYHGQYQNFRTISDKSDDNAFIHPGFRAHNFMEQALEEIQIDRLYEHLKGEFLNVYLS